LFGNYENSVYVATFLCVLVFIGMLVFRRKTIKETDNIL